MNPIKKINRPKETGKPNKIPTDRKRIQEGTMINSPQRKRNKACGEEIPLALQFLI